MEVTPMAALLENIGTVLESMIGWVGDVIGAFTATGNEILYFSLIATFGLIAIGIFGRLLRLGIQ